MAHVDIPCPTSSISFGRLSIRALAPVETIIDSAVNVGSFDDGSPTHTSNGEVWRLTRVTFFVNNSAPNRSAWP